MSGKSFRRLTVDRGDLELGEVVAEADCFVETFAALEFEGDAFFATMLFYDFGGDACAFDGRCTNSGVASVIYEEDFTKLDFLVCDDGKLVDTDGVTFLHAVLLTAGFKNCVGHVGIRLNVKW